MVNLTSLQIILKSPNGNPGNIFSHKIHKRIRSLSLTIEQPAWVWWLPSSLDDKFSITVSGMHNSNLIAGLISENFLIT